MVQNGAQWCKMTDVANIERFVRQSVSIPTGIARRVRALAKTRKTSANRVLVDLIEAGLQSKETEKERFFSLVSRLTQSRDPAERQRLKEELARMTFGD
jgi:ParB-like chromosome segregation protein Spo0J